MQNVLIGFCSILSSSPLLLPKHRLDPHVNQDYSITAAWKDAEHFPLLQYFTNTTGGVILKCAFFFSWNRKPAGRKVWPRFFYSPIWWVHWILQYGDPKILLLWGKWIFSALCNSPLGCMYFCTLLKFIWKILWTKVLHWGSSTPYTDNCFKAILQSLHKRTWLQRWNLWQDSICSSFVTP